MNTRDIHLLPKFESAFLQGNWDKLSCLLNPKLFRNFESEEFVAFPVLAKVAQILTTEDPVIPEHVKIACLKCLGNSCFNGYVHKEYDSVNIDCGLYSQKLYSCLATENLGDIKNCNSYPFNSCFPYEGVIEWTSNFIISCKTDNDLSDDQLEILRLSIQFLCNHFTFACESSSSPDQYKIPKYLNNTNLKNLIMNLTHSDHVPLVRPSCVFIHNALKEFEGKCFTESEKIRFCLQLLKPIKEGFESAKEALILLLCQSNVLQNAYDDMVIEDKLCLLEVIYNEISEFVYKNKEGHIFTQDTIKFLAERFCRRSDLILRTVDTYLDDMQPREIIILLDILGTVTSGASDKFNFLKEYKSLLINCTYLLKSIQMIGRQSNNYFTPLQKLSDVAPAAQANNELKANESESEKSESETSTRKNDLHKHPAYGFKAGLIRIIGNMSYKNKECQDLLREMGAVPLLLDCCNIDARNPLIMQWTILGLRNLCDGNPENQEIIRNCTRVGVVENSVLQEMGLTLHEDEEGKKIGIVPLPRDPK